MSLYYSIIASEFICTSPARTASQVTGILGLVSYSGFFTVSEEQNSNMFFWFFKAQVRDHFT